MIVDRLDAMEAPLTGDIDEAILPAPTLRVIANLAGRRLTHLHERRPFQMVSGDCGSTEAQPGAAGSNHQPADAALLLKVAVN
jgi:hypothetical protein